MRIGISRHMVSFTALAAAIGCGESDEPSDGSRQVTDSAGIPVITSPPADAVYAHVAEQPALSVGELDGAEEYLFGLIVSVARDGQGNLVVADSRAGEIRVFDGQGGHVRTFGRMGDGPGEFRILTGAWPVPDGGVVAVDRELERITRFDAEGSLVGTAGFAGVGEMGVFAARGMAGGDMILSQVTDLSMPSPDLSALRDQAEILGNDGASVLFVRHGLNGEIVDTLARRQGEKVSMSTSTSDGTMSLELLVVPFSPRPYATGSSREIAVTGGAEYEVALFDEAGTPRRIVRLGEAPVLRTEDHLEAHVRNSGRRAPDETSIRGMMETYREMPMPDRLPGYTQLRFADTGELWARRYLLPGGDMIQWDVFGTDGHHLGRVQVPASFRIQEVSRNQVVGIARDDLGVERVEVRDLNFNDP